MRAINNVVIYHFLVFLNPTPFYHKFHQTQNGSLLWTLTPFQHPYRTSLVAQTVKYLPAMRETRVQSLGWEDPLEKVMAAHSSTLAWKIPWMEEPGRLQSMRSQRVRND